jgi:prolyl-tRNA synthetase
MRISELFTKTSKTHPADETSKNAQLLIQAGFVYKVMAGVYAYTPLGLAYSRTSSRSSARR